MFDSLMTKTNMHDHFRHEHKFVCNTAELAIIESRLRVVMKLDPHADAEGVYQIRSVYFDDAYRTCYYDNENGVDPREKYRIRIYNGSPERISLEKKTKCNGLTGKESCLLDRGECDKMLNGRQGLQNSGPGETGPGGLYGEFLRQYTDRQMRPAVLIEYYRKPYIYSLGNVRVTFDMEITASRCVTRLFDGNISKVNILPTGYHVMEVKYDGFLPDEIVGIINYPHLQRSTFSKFYLGCRAVEGRVQ